MMAVMNNEVVEPAFPLRSAAASPAEHHRARDLNERELDEVVGGGYALLARGLVHGALSASAGNVAIYAVGHRANGYETTRSGYIGAALLGATMGLTGAASSTLILASSAGKLKGAGILGASIYGSSVALSAAAAAGSTGEDQ